METETLENRLQKRIHVSLYALLFLTVLLGLSVILEGCTIKNGIARKQLNNKSAYIPAQGIQVAPTNIQI